MKIKVSEATPVQLNWMVARCVNEGFANFVAAGWPYDPSTNWEEGGPIIERKLITVQPVVNPTGWMARTQKCDSVWEGPTPLIAAMRCYVAWKLGDEVEIPDELI